MKDEGGSIWPTKEVVFMAGYYINTLEKLLDEQVMLDQFVTLTSVNYVALIALK